ncbi:MAG: glycosyltransferase family 39 protein [Candidatus Beckwithbacteria bacterium]
MNKKTIIIWLGLIIILATFLRFYQLGSNPPSLSWDETAIGWNAKSIFHTRRDEYGTRLPLVFKSFGDYKAPLYIYLTAPIVGLFGLNMITIRLLSVLAGISAVVVLYLLTEKLTKNQTVALTTVFLLAVTPWSVMLSRGAFEQNLALLFILLNIYFFKLALKKPLFFYPSALFFTLSLYTYHSPKIFSPLFLIALVIIYRKKLFIKKLRLSIIGSAVFGLLLITPLIKSTFKEGAAMRFQSTSIFYEEDEKLSLNFKLVKKLTSNYLLHYSPKFYFSGVTTGFRAQLNNQGILLWVTAPFLIIGLLQLIKLRRKSWAKLVLAWLLLGPAAAVLGKEAPHAIRAMNMLPALLIVTSLGISKTIKLYKKPALIITSGLIVINLAFFLHHYFVKYPIYSAPDWQYGYKQISDIALKYEDDVEQIVISSFYGQPHIFILLNQQRQPLDVFWGAMSKYMYRKIDWKSDFVFRNKLFIGPPEEIPQGAPGLIETINFPNGLPAFRIVIPKE